MDTNISPPTNSKVKSPGPNHVPALDGLRGIAILMVIACHAFAMPNGASLQSKIFYWFGVLGYGVTLFFVLSGFLITRILLAAKNGTHYFKSFYARRALRIFPLYYFAITFVVVLYKRTFGDWLGYATYLQDIAPTALLVAPLAHFWSLAVEEQFYLIWPLVVFQVSPKSLFRLSICIVIASLASRIIFVMTTQDTRGISWFPLNNFDALALGAILAIKEPDIPALRALFKAMVCLGLIGLITMIHGGLDSSFQQCIGRGSAAILFAGVIGLAKPKGWLANRFLMTIGKYSYGMYVWHYPICCSLYREKLESRSVFQTLEIFLLILGGSFVAALISWYLLESRFLALKKFFPMGGKATHY